MTEVIFNYNELFCIRHSDTGDKAEPYMWFAFVFVDVNTIAAGRFVVTLNMADSFSIPRTIRGERKIPFSNLILVDEYEVRGSIQVSRITPPGRCQDLRDGYNRVAQVFKDSEAALHRLREEFLKAPASSKPGVLKEIEKIRANKAHALEAVGRAHDDYRACLAEDPTGAKVTT